MASVVAATSDQWAVVIANSKHYSYYGHQADSSHAVKLLLENGVPRDQIIHFAYDDIAYNVHNPFPGTLYNRPTINEEGLNVYDSSQIDYRGSEVNRTNFFKVLLGDETASGPVLKSTKESKVFVYMVGHGAFGMVPMPDTHTDQWVYADQLDHTLTQMKEKGLFKELLFYMDTDESGSMFNGLHAHDGILAVTSARPNESSWATFCGNDAIVNSLKIGACLGTQFSINWMLDSEYHHRETENIHDQVSII